MLHVEAAEDTIFTRLKKEGEKSYFSAICMYMIIINLQETFKINTGASHLKLLNFLSFKIKHVQKVYPFTINDEST